MKTAIVCTLVNSVEVIDTFIEYHMSIGFSRIFLFFDQESDPAIEMAKSYDCVSVWTFNERLFNEWEECPAFISFHPFIHREAMARQILNTEVAIRKCKEMDIQWLLHIDIDELFYCPKETVGQHFARMSSMGNFYIRYPNHEAVPGKLNIVNYFLEVDTFKRNLKTLSIQQQQVIKDIFPEGRGYFHFYGNGKSAIHIGDDLFVLSVREIDCPYAMHESMDAAILHFPCCGFDHFYSKYVTLSNFPDRWFGSADIKKNVPMHVKCRDAVLTLDKASAAAFYQATFVNQLESHLELFQKNDVILKLDLSHLFKRPPGR